MMGTYAKALLAIALAAGAGLVTALGTSPQQNLSHLGWVDWLTFIGAVLGSGGVTWLTENGAAHTYIKAVVAAGGAFVTSLIVALSDNVISQAEWITAICAALLALASVYQIRNGARQVVA